MRLFRNSGLFLALFLSQATQAATMVCETIDIEDDHGFSFSYDPEAKHFTRMGGYSVCIEGVDCVEHEGDTELTQSPYGQFPFVKFWVGGAMFSFEKFIGSKNSCIAGEMMQQWGSGNVMFAAIECIDSHSEWEECWPTFDRTNRATPPQWSK